jgi:hypothetical protein
LKPFMIGMVISHVFGSRVSHQYSLCQVYLFRALDVLRLTQTHRIRSDIFHHENLCKALSHKQ